jgi:hypothetical protein
LNDSAGTLATEALPPLLPLPPLPYVLKLLTRETSTEKVPLHHSHPMDST